MGSYSIFPLASSQGVMLYQPFRDEDVELLYKLKLFISIYDSSKY